MITFAEIKGGGCWKGILWRILRIIANYWGTRVKRLDKDKEKYYESAQMLIEGESHAFSALLLCFLQ